MRAFCPTNPCDSEVVEQVKFAQIEVTTRCNFTCGFCCGRYMKQADLTWELFTATLDTFPNLRHVQLQGEGEPLLHPRYFEMARELKRRGIRVSVITNGSLLTKEGIADQLLEIPFQRVSISIESPDPQRFKEIRGGSLAKVKEGIRLLVKSKKARKQEYPIIDLAVTVLSSTIDSYLKLAELYRELDLDGGLSSQYLQEMESYASIYPAPMRSEILTEDAIARFEALRARIDAEIGTGPIGGFYDEMFGQHDPSEKRCAWLSSGVFVSVSGSLTPCCRIKNAQKHGCGQIGKGPHTAFLQRRALLERDLADGIVPAACVKCPHADAIVKSGAIRAAQGA